MLHSPGSSSPFDLWPHWPCMEIIPAQAAQSGTRWQGRHWWHGRHWRHGQHWRHRQHWRHGRQGWHWRHGRHGRHCLAALAALAACPGSWLILLRMWILHLLCSIANLALYKLAFPHTKWKRLSLGGPPASRCDVLTSYLDIIWCHMSCQNEAAQVRSSENHIFQSSDLWPWSSNSSEFLSRSTPPTKSWVHMSNDSAGRELTNRHTDRQTDRFYTLDCWCGRE